MNELIDADATQILEAMNAISEWLEVNAEHCDDMGDDEKEDALGNSLSCMERAQDFLKGANL